LLYSIILRIKVLYIQHLKKKGMKRILLIIVLVIVNISCDQITKSIVRDNIVQNERIELVTNHMTLTNVENSGAFLGAGSSLPPFAKTLFFLVVPSLLMIWLLYLAFARKGTDTIMLIGLSFIIGGGIGNIFDRFIYGSVTDFLHIGFGIFRTGIFNMADVSVMIGVGILLIHQVINRKKLSEDFS